MPEELMGWGKSKDIEGWENAPVDISGWEDAVPPIEKKRKWWQRVTPEEKVSQKERVKAQAIDEVLVEFSQYPKIKKALVSAYKGENID